MIVLKNMQERMGGMTIVKFAASPVAWRAVTRAPDTHVQLPYPPESERQPCSSSGEPVLSLENGLVL